MSSKKRVTSRDHLFCNRLTGLRLGRKYIYGQWEKSECELRLPLTAERKAWFHQAQESDSRGWEELREDFEAIYGRAW